MGTDFAEKAGMKVAAWAMSDAANLSTVRAAGRLAQIPFARNGVIHSLPGMLGQWTNTRDMPAIPAESFRQWWARRRQNVVPGGTK